MEVFSIKNVPDLNRVVLCKKNLSKESHFVAKQTFGFDFIFIDKFGAKHPICVEVNGWQSGIDGLRKLSIAGELDSGARIATRANSHHFFFNLAYRIWRRKYLPQFVYFAPIDDWVSDYVVKKIAMRRWRQKVGADLETMCPKFFEDKLAQKKLIPLEYRVNPVQPNKMQEGKEYIIKHRFKDGGFGIKTIKFKPGIFDFHELAVLQNKYIIEPLLDALPADLDKYKEKGNRISSMRLYARFLFYYSKSENKIIIVPNLVLAYQRVANKKYTRVVNLSQGAVPFCASQREFDLVWPVAKATVVNYTKEIFGISNCSFLL